MYSGDLNGNETPRRAQGVPWRKGIERRLNALERRIAGQEEMTAAASDEVRTRRLVIVDSDGTQRIVGEIASGCAELRIELPGEPGSHSGVVIYAIAGDERVPAASIGIQLWARGDSVAEFEASPDDSGEWRPTLNLSTGP
jgi:hypothetical protein